MKKENIKLMCLAGVFTAIVFVFTAYLHIPIHTGYIHIGDGFIYLASCILPLPYAVFVGAGGALLADCLTGFALWAPASVIIKAITVFFFCRKTHKIISKRNIFALVPSSLICIGGYYIYDALITGNFFSPIAAIWGNITQCVFSSIVFILIGITFDKIDIKKFIR
ncbi:MAG: TIGR04002 family protein [Ruminococcaceae bacterium]|nr:TIGR04002 family protein [Oscillospiraceae bacterium]